MIVVIPACNEAATIARTIESCDAVRLPEPYHVLVVDMGSTDETTRIAAASGAQVVNAPKLERFDVAYNRALTCANGLARDSADWILFLRARRVLEGAWGYVTGRCDTATARFIHGDISFRHQLAWRAGVRARFIGATHELLDTGGHLECDSGLTVRTLDVPHPRPAKERWERDLRLLDGDDSPRAAFYRAQTLECLGRKALAYIAWCDRVERADGWRQEVYVAARHAVTLAPDLAAAAYWARAAGIADARRGEAMLALGHRYFEVGRYHAALTAATSAVLMHRPEPDALFVEYNLPWQAEEMRALCFDKLGEKLHAKAAFKLAKQKKSELA